MHVRASRVHIHIVVSEDLLVWRCNIAGLESSTSSSSQKLHVALGPQLPGVTTQQTLAAHGSQVPSNGDALPGRLVHEAEGKPSLWPPRNNHCRLATIQAVANTTQQLLSAHARVGLQPWVWPEGLLHLVLAK